MYYTWNCGFDGTQYLFITAEYNCTAQNSLYSVKYGGVGNCYRFQLSGYSFGSIVSSQNPQNKLFGNTTLQALGSYSFTWPITPGNALEIQLQPVNDRLYSQGVGCTTSMCISSTTAYSARLPFFTGRLFSQGNVYDLRAQNDHNLVIYSSSSIVWASGITRSCTAGSSTYLEMQDDGNLVSYCNGVAAWPSNTNGRGVKPYMAILRTDGKLCIYDSTGTIIWST